MVKIQALPKSQIEKYGANRVINLFSMCELVGVEAKMNPDWGTIRA
jgi:hypothetical protein